MLLESKYEPLGQAEMACPVFAKTLGSASLFPTLPQFHAPSMPIWLSFGSRLVLGQIHKSLFDNH
jgi:hypothetical protein